MKVTLILIALFISGCVQEKPADEPKPLSGEWYIDTLRIYSNAYRKGQEDMENWYENTLKDSTEIVIENLSISFHQDTIYHYTDGVNFLRMIGIDLSKIVIFNLHFNSITTARIIIETEDGDSLMIGYGYGISLNKGE